MYGRNIADTTYLTLYEINQSIITRQYLYNTRAPSSPCQCQVCEEIKRPKSRNDGVTNCPDYLLSVVCPFVCLSTIHIKFSFFTTRLIKFVQMKDHAQNTMIFFNFFIIIKIDPER